MEDIPVSVKSAYLGKLLGREKRLILTAKLGKYRPLFKNPMRLSLIQTI
jgi:hypothetical protein